MEDREGVQPLEAQLHRTRGAERRPLLAQGSLLPWRALIRRAGIRVVVVLFTVLAAAAADPPTPGNLAAAAAPSGTGTAARSFEPPWSWPLTPVPDVVRHFDPPPRPWLAGHRGVDLRVGSSREVRSPAKGTVVFAGEVVDRPVITVDHGGGLLSSFEPATAVVPELEPVEEGQAIGTVGFQAHCPFSCIHWGVRLKGVYVNPLNYVLDRRPSVLLPLNGP